MSAMYALVAEKGYDKASMNQVMCRRRRLQTGVVLLFRIERRVCYLDMVEKPVSVLDPDDTEFASIDDRGEYYSYLHAMGRSILASYHGDEERRRVLAEIDMQATRIPAVAQHQQRLTKTTIEAFAAVLKHGADIRSAPPALRCRERGAIPVRHHFGFQHARGAECGRRRCRRVEQSSRPAPSGREAAIANAEMRRALVLKGLSLLGQAQARGFTRRERERNPRMFHVKHPFAVARPADRRRHAPRRKSPQGMLRYASLRDRAKMGCQSGPQRRLVSAAGRPPKP